MRNILRRAGLGLIVVALASITAPVVLAAAPTRTVEEVRISDEGQDEIRFDRYSSLRDALAQLPEEQREVLVLRHVAGLTPLEIARHMDRTESSVHGLHHRGRGTLQAALRELGAAPVVQAPSAA